jgi:hypothetical protein
MRPSGSAALDLFNEIYLEPIFGKPDEFGNYIKIVNNKDGSSPNLCFTAHSDTVHYEGGIQDLKAEGNWLFADDSSCLGADCTTGVWLILEMIHSQVPGIYVVHADEEVGCIGSRKLVKSQPAWLDHTDAVISFDRKGNDSVVTHQLGIRTASDAFAKSFALAIDMPMKPDTSGVYTDSNEYVDVVGECTNISVGYLAQHTKSECQDMDFLVELRDKLIDADWSKLVFSRRPMEYDQDDYMGYRSKFDSKFDRMAGDAELDMIYDIVLSHPEEIADYLYNLGFSSDVIAEELSIDTNKYLSKFLEQDLRERRVG